MIGSTNFECSVPLVLDLQPDRASTRSANPLVMLRIQRFGMQQNRLDDGQQIAAYALAVVVEHGRDILNVTLRWIRLDEPLDQRFARHKVRHWGVRKMVSIASLISAFASATEAA